MRSNKQTSNKKYANFDYSLSSSSSDYFSKNSSVTGDSYTPSFTMTSSSNNSDSGIMSSEETLQFIINNPINPNCWRENVHAELEKFAQEKLKQAGQVVPHNSPMKKSSKSGYSRIPIAPRLDEFAFFTTPQGQKEAKLNQTLKLVNKSNGRCYEDMINEARTFKDMWEIKGIGNCETLLKACGVQSNDQLMEIINNLSAVGKLMFLFLVDKYPTTNQESQIFILHHLQFQQKNEKGDIYLAFKNLDNELYIRFPTKDSYNHQYAEDNLNTFEFKF